MKTIFRILIILLVSALVAGALYLIIENTAIVSTGNNALGLNQKPAMSGGELAQPPTRAGGDLDHGNVSFMRGLSEVLISLAKLFGITAIVLFFQYLVGHMKKRRYFKYEQP
jgi:hypothetical protein